MATLPAPPPPPRRPRPTPAAGRHHPPAEMAAALAVHERTVYRAIVAGKIRAIRCGGAWRIPPEEYERILARGWR